MFLFILKRNSTEIEANLLSPLAAYSQCHIAEGKNLAHFAAYQWPLIQLEQIEANQRDSLK